MQSHYLSLKLNELAPNGVHFSKSMLGHRYPVVDKAVYLRITVKDVKDVKEEYHMFTKRITDNMVKCKKFWLIFVL